MINGKVLLHVRAPVMTASGYGVHSRQILDYLLTRDDFEVILESINWGETPYKHNLPNQMKYYEAMAKYEQVVAQNIQIDLSVQVTIPNEFHKRGQVNIGVTAGIEVDRCSREWILKCNEMDLIVVPSTFSQKILSGTTYEVVNNKTNEKAINRIEKPIVVIPEWFEKPSEIKPLDLQFSTKFNFLYVGLWGNKGNFGEDRKNIANLIKFFFSTFKDEPDVGLVLKTNIINASTEDRLFTIKRINEIKSNFKNAKCKVHLIHEHLTDEELWGLYTHPQIKGYLGIQHGEGYGLPLLEASAAGLSVITTDWSGQLDFLRIKNGYLPLDYKMVKIPECQFWKDVMEKDSEWADVPEEIFKKVTRKFYGSSLPIIAQAKNNVSWLEENFSRKTVEKLLKDFFDQFTQKNESVREELKIQQQKSQKDLTLEKISEQVEISDKQKVLYIMPRSAGDVLISTAIVEALKVRHEGCDFYFATTEPFKELLNAVKDIKVIEYKDEMMWSELTAEIWDYVYNPTVNVQYNFSNWLLGNGEYSVRLLEEFAKNCNLTPKDIIDYSVSIKECSVPENDFIVFGPAGVKQAKKYSYWTDVISNIKLMAPELKIAQVGLKSEKLEEGCLDYRGLSYAESAYLMSKCQMFLGVDSFPAHLAAAVSKPHIVVYGSTSANTVTPIILQNKPLQVLIETTNRNGCKNPCYKDTCSNMKNGHNCLSNVDASTICEIVFNSLKKLNSGIEK